MAAMPKTIAWSNKERKSIIGAPCHINKTQFCKLFEISNSFTYTLVNRGSLHRPNLAGIFIHTKFSRANLWRRSTSPSELCHGVVRISRDLFGSPEPLCQRKSQKDIQFGLNGTQRTSWKPVSKANAKGKTTSRISCALSLTGEHVFPQKYIYLKSTPPHPTKLPGNKKNDSEMCSSLRTPSVCVVLQMCKMIKL